MKWSNVNLIFRREMRDQLRDRRTLFTVVIMPMLLYPLAGHGHAAGRSVYARASDANLDHGFGEPSCSTGSAGRRRNFGSVGRCQNRSTDRNRSSADPTHELEKYIRDFHTSNNKQARELIDQLIQKELKERKYDAAVFFTNRIDSPEQTDLLDPNSTKAPGPDVLVFVDSASDRSRIAGERIGAILQRWKNAWTSQLLAANDVPASINSGIVLRTSDVANKVGKRAAAWSKILPFIVMIWCLTGAFYPAIDLCAGEKERGTFETLLSSPAERSEIAIGKLLTVMSFSMATSLLNLVSMAITGIMLASKVGAMATFGTPPIHSIGWLLLALVPISACSVPSL